ASRPSYMMPKKRVGRGAAFNPPSAYERFHIEEFEETRDDDRPIPTEFFVDASRTVLAKNDSPDVPFTYSLNPYRGCEHGCIYCYARPSHQYLGFSAGLDFETKILVKPDAPRLLEEAFRKRSWKPQVVALSGNTDPYQPAERTLRLTRRCLEVFLKFRNPVSVITKNFLVTRDLDVLKELSSLNLVHVFISITSLNPRLIRVMEPRTSTPPLRLKAIEALAQVGIPVGVNAAPIIPGLTDEELPSILKEAAARGATMAGTIVVRLPGPVRELFVEWLHREFPERAEKVLGRIRGVRRGKLSEAEFGRRMKGEGEYARALERMFRLACQKYGLNREKIPLSTGCFLRSPEAQVEMF
ncbi:MAG TPA: PA0069 family radical SAM protein, partial [Bacteroidota bacterium]